MNEKILRHKKLIIFLFALAAGIGLFLIQFLKIDYNLMDYLPKDSPSTVSLEMIESVFGDISEGATKVAVPVESFAQALELKAQIQNVEYVDNVKWLDDVVSINQPESYLDPDTLDAWYQDGYALFAVQFDDDSSGKNTTQALADIRTIIGTDGAMAGGAVNNSAAKQSTGKELGEMMMIIIPIVLIIMLIATRSWVEPFLFLFVIGISILINTGTNALLDSVSFVTQTTAAILQLAVSMDYSIFLLHAFADFRDEGMPPREAMLAAMKRSYSTILSSGMTTVLGFAALIFMRFLIGPDMGIVLAKGVIFSLLSVMFLLPVLASMMSGLIEKTRHRSFLPRFETLGKLILRAGTLIVIAAFLLIVPAYLAQRQNSFIYGSSAVTNDAESQIGRDDRLIADLFGRNNQLILMVPSGDDQKETELADQILDLTGVTDVASYVTTIGTEIPQESVAPEKLSKFRSGGYSRFVIEMNCESEGDEAFSLVEQIRSVSQEQYPDSYYLSGSSANIYDMKQVVTADNRVVTLISVAAIGMVILLTFRSLALPLMLLCAIELSIWINLSIPYFNGSPMIYIGYMIISAVQLGATVDYAILYAGRYLEKRKIYGKKEAALQAVSETFGSILTSATILMTAGTVIFLISSDATIAQLGQLIGRGAVLSAVMVMIFLPNLMVLCDRIIAKTTKNSGFTEV
ncbi:MAG: RND family transporter [Anaerofustis sp.]